MVTGHYGRHAWSGARTRPMWIPTRRLFRAGTVVGTEWDAANIEIIFRGLVPERWLRTIVPYRRAAYNQAIGVTARRFLALIILLPVSFLLRAGYYNQLVAQFLPLSGYLNTIFR